MIDVDLTAEAHQPINKVRSVVSTSAPDQWATTPSHQVLKDSVNCKHLPKSDPKKSRKMSSNYR